MTTATPGAGHDRRDRADQIVTVARQWLGTPYLHQTSVKGAGSDCLGLIRGIWRDVVGPERVLVPPYTLDWSEPSGQEVLMQAADRLLVRRPDKSLVPGCVLLFRMRAGMVAKHLGVVSQVSADLKFIHAYTGHGVVESTLSDPWLRRLAATYDFPQGA